MGVEQSRALLRSGKRCSIKAQTAGFCRQHRPLPQTSSLIDKIKNAGKITAAAGACLGLVEQIVNLWSVLPKGPGPKMPDARCGSLRLH